MSRAVLVLASLALVSCGGQALETGQSSAEVEETGLGLVVEAPDGSKRIPYIGGAFVTKAREMPVEVEQAVMGLPTDRPVVVWAGLDANVGRRDVSTARGR